MGFVNKTYQKLYDGIASGNLKIIFKYVIHTDWQPYELDFTIINDIELEWGYEDDDQLTFYPAALSLEIRDFSRRNYDILKFAVGSYAPYQGRNNFEVNLYLNNVIEFSGFIDEKSIEWDESTRTTKFDILDWTALLSTTQVNSSYTPDPENATFGYILNDLQGLFRGVQHNGQYYVYPNMPNAESNPSIVTNNPETFKGFSAGYYFKHNWKFLADLYPNEPVIERSWDLNVDPTGYKGVGIWNGYIYQGASNYADLIKGWALTTGTSIGAQRENKVYVFKRFVKQSEVSSIARRLDLDGQYKILDYQIYVHLNKMIGVRNITKYSHSLVFEGEFPVVDGNDPSSQPLFGDMQLDIATGLETWIYQPHPYPPFVGLPFIRCVRQSPFAVNGCIKFQDPSLSGSWIEGVDKVTTKWYYQSRIRQRNRIELKLRGISYYMFEFFLIYLPDVFGDLFRPMKVRWNLTQNITNLTAIEVGL